MEDQNKPIFEVTRLLDQALTKMQEAKPGDRSEADRHVAIAITDLQKVLAYWSHWIIMVEHNTKEAI